jgi:tetratricopeptide (TPR) repeat protein
MSLLDRMWRSSAETLYRRGMAAFNAGCHGEALDLFEKAAASLHDATDPVRSLALFYAAEAAAHLGCAALPQEPRQAQRCFAKALEYNPHFPDLHYFTATAAALLGDFEATLHHVRMALELDPEHVEAHCLLALALHDLGDSEAAGRELEWVAAHAGEWHRPVGPLGPLLVRHATSLPGLEALKSRLGAGGAAGTRSEPSPKVEAERGAGR